MTNDASEQRDERRRNLRRERRRERRRSRQSRRRSRQRRRRDIAIRDLVNNHRPLSLIPFTQACVVAPASEDALRAAATRMTTNDVFPNYGHCEIDSFTGQPVPGISDEVLAWNGIHTGHTHSNCALFGPRGEGLNPARCVRSTTGGGVCVFDGESPSWGCGDVSGGVCCETNPRYVRWGWY